MNLAALSMATAIRTGAGLCVGAVIGSAFAHVIAMLAALGIAAGVGEGVGSIVGIIAGTFGFGALKGGFYGMPLALLAGWPAHLLLMRAGARGLFVYIVAAIAIAAAAHLFNAIVLRPPLAWSLLAIDALAGAFAGAIFWLARRPDRDHT